MKCTNHNDKDAVGTCLECRKGLCKKCADRFEMPLCEPCLTTHNSKVEKQLYYGLVVTAVFLVAGTYLFYVKGHVGFGQSLFGGCLFAGTYWGWRFLSDHAPRLTMGTTTIWFIYLFVKFIGAYIIGMFVGPYQIFKMFRELTKIRGLKHQIAHGNI